MSVLLASKSDVPNPLVYDVALVFFRTIINIFFREIRPRGTFNIPRDGPVIFVGAPHHNQFLDPLLLALQVLRETRRHVQFLTAASSLNRRFVGFFARLIASIPVARAADYAKAGTGQISLSDEDPCLVIGHGTRFLVEFKPQSQILLPKSVDYAVAEIVEVMSDTELRIKKEFGGPKGTAKIREKVAEFQKAGEGGLTFKTMPHIDQHNMYQYVYQSLTDGGCIGIFPEGGSHDRTDLLPLKAGVSVMALGAMANNPDLKVKIVPVGLSYFHPHRFRSRAVVEFGSALDVPPDLVELFKKGGNEKREAVGKLLNFIYDALRTVTILAPDYDTLMLIQAARRLYRTPGQHLSLGQVVELNKRFLEGYMHFKDDPRIQKLRSDVLKYNRLVRDLGLRDHQVPGAQKAGWKTFGLLSYRLLLLFIWTVLALPGGILNGPIFLAASIISRKKAREALAASTVKIAARDVVATWKILISMGVAPLLYTFYAILATLVAVKANVPLAWRLWTPFLTIVTLPIVGYAALKFGEAGMDVLKSLRPLVVALFPGQQRTLDRLKAMRAEVANELIDVINEFGPKLYGKKFDEWRILIPSASVPPSGVPSEKAAAGVDARENILNHPMTWLDERLFGWSKSAKRGTSAWAGTRSQDISRIPTPDGSDDEEEADYDNILGYLDASAQNSRLPNARSRNSSYADLQRLRKNPGNGDVFSSISAVATGEELASKADGECFGQHTRIRKASLSDTVPVQRIGELDRRESFNECTQDLNQEIDERRLHLGHKDC